MGKFQLGEFEEVVMLTVAVLFGDAYGVTIKKDIEDRLQRKVSVGALQSALKRLEEKGYLNATEGGASSERGGRPKRFFTLTASGKEAVAYTKEVRDQLWGAIPNAAWELKYYTN